MALQVIEMMNDAQVAQMVRENWKVEIDRAVDQAQQHRTELDRWFRREWHREAAVSKWTDERQRRYREWARSQRRTSEEEDAWRELKEQKRKRVAWVDKAIKGSS